MAINLPNGLLKLLDIDPSTIEVSLSNAGNIFSGTDANEHILGNGGGDVIDAKGGSDIVEGGTGGDTLVGGDGNVYVEGGAGGDAMNGGAGIDTLGYSQSGSSVKVTLNDSGGGTTSGSGSGPGNHAQGDTIGGFENVVGSLFNDTLTGNNSANVLAGLAGADKLFGMGGNDILIGGVGADDELVGGDEGDTIHGGAGNDTILGGNGIDHLFGDDGDDFIDVGFSDEGNTQTATGGSGADTLVCSGDGAAKYSSSPDAIDVNQTSNVFLGGDAEGDSVTGFSGIVGSNFDDTIKGFSDVDGGGGNDQIYALNQANVVGGRELKGGDGTDTFYFTTFLADDDYTITDYDYASGEKIDLSAIDADPDALEDQAFVWDSGESSSPGTISQREDEDGIVLTLNVGDQQVSIVLQDYFNDGEPLPADAFIL